MNIFIYLICFLSDPSTNDNFTCTCPEGFVGYYCDRAYCDGDKCANGGICDPSARVISNS